MAEFIEAFRNECISDQPYPNTLQVKFGRSIDQDREDTKRSERINDLVTQYHDIDWDIAQDGYLTDMIAALASREEPVYRAYLSLGSLTRELFDQLKRVNSPENQHDLTLDSWSLIVGPIEMSSLGSMDTYLVGWISLDISGYGYLYPWTLQELMERAEQHRDIQKVMALCKRMWPVPPGKPDQRIIESRQALGDLWPYRTYDLPWDWYWGLAETG